jgi:hypothetical protein
MRPTPEHQELHAAPEPARRLPRVLTLRDIPDVEALVESTLERLSLPVRGAYSDRLVLAGVDAVLRVDRSVPREHPLASVVVDVLDQGLLEFHESERPRTRLRAA